MEFTFLMPCLNEAHTLPLCIGEAQSAIDRLGLDAEILIADNCSTDGSAQIAVDCGARVGTVPKQGYGAALIGGIAANSWTKCLSSAAPVGVQSSPRISPP